MKEVPGTICQKKHGRKVGDFQAQITSLTHNFRGKPGTTLAIIKVQYSMEQHHKERKRKSSSGKSPFGSTALNGRSSSASALSLINFNHKITSLTHNFRDKPGTTLAIIKVQYSMEQHHKERKRKSSSGKSPFGSTALNGRSSSTSALSLINFFSHNFQVKPVIGLDYLTRYYFDE